MRDWCTLDLLDWKHRIFDLYSGIRSDPDPVHASLRWRAERQTLYRAHPQSPIPAERRRNWLGPSYFDYDPGFRLL